MFALEGEMPLPYRAALSGFALALALVTVDARACMPPPPEPTLDGESAAAYTVRVEELNRTRAEQWLRERQTNALNGAQTIFIGRLTYWSPPYGPRPRQRGGRPPPPPLATDFAAPRPSYFKPIDWLKGTKPPTLIRTTNHMTSCGMSGFGDTTFASNGALFVFFAKVAPVSEKTLIDAIAVDNITDPALLAFVAKYRQKPDPKLSAPK